MKAEHSKNLTSSSLPKALFHKWLNLKSPADDFPSDYQKGRRKSCSENEGRDAFFRREVSGGWLPENAVTVSPDPTECGPDPPDIFPKMNRAKKINDEIRMFVGTWNVGGRSPNRGLDLSDWLMSTPDPADIFVIGFQEIVPLTAGNVLGSESMGPTAKWLALIRRALNSRQTRQPDNDNGPVRTPRVSFSDLLRYTNRGDDGDDGDEQREESSRSDEDGDGDGFRESLYNAAGSSDGEDRYYLTASKQMVGIFLCVWVRAGLMRHVNNIKVSCIGRGILGYMGNKGSVSISMCLRQTTFCFVCTHLASGEKDGDEIKRNFDVMEIIKRTRFQSSPNFLHSPETILAHDKIIWLGDLNYRLNSPTYLFDIHGLLQRKDWKVLQENDQLRIERNAGRVFAGWEEGIIYFPPTYKYLADSNIYAVNSFMAKDKRRTPAWCDRILWRGKGMKQMWYIRGENRFSDHRPVYSLFSIELNSDDRSHSRSLSENINVDD